MSGHIVKRGKRYSIVLEVGTNPLTGKRKQKWISGYRTKKDAQTDLIKIQREIQTGEYVEPTKLTTGEWLDEWMEHYSIHLARKTRANYQGVMGVAKTRIGHIPLRSLRPDVFQELYAEWQKAGIAPSTIGTRHNALHAALDRAVKLGLIGRNPTLGVVLPREGGQEARSLSRSQVELLLQAARDSGIYVPVLLALTTGMRRGEVLALKWSRVHENHIVVDLSLEEGNPLRFKEPKTARSRRMIAVPSWVIDELKSHKARQDEERLLLGERWDDNDLVCPAAFGRPMQPPVFSREFRRLAEKQKLPITFHGLRHTHATLLMQEGINPKIVQERLGHSTLAMTMDTYSHVSPGMQTVAAAAMDSLKPSGSTTVAKLPLTTQTACK